MIDLHIHSNHSDGTDYHALRKPTIELGSGICGNVQIPTHLVSEWIEEKRKR